MSGEMCDQETRNYFNSAKRREWTNTIMLTVLIGIAGWMAVQTFEQGKEVAAQEVKFNDHVREFDRLVALIPDGFFTDRTRYGQGDAHRDQEHNRKEREANHALVMAEISLLDRRLQINERTDTKHYSESALYIQMIKDTVINVKELQKLVWKLVPHDPD